MSEYSQVKTWTEFVIAARALDTSAFLEEGDGGLHTPSTTVFAHLRDENRKDDVAFVQITHDQGNECAWGKLVLVDFEPGCVEVYSVYNRNEPYFSLTVGEIADYETALIDMSAMAISPNVLKEHYEVQLVEDASEFDVGIEDIGSWARFLYTLQDLLMLIDEHECTGGVSVEGRAAKVIVTLTVGPGVKVSMSWDFWGYGEVVLDRVLGVDKVTCVAIAQACAIEGKGPEFPWSVGEVTTYDVALNRIEDWATRYW